MRPYGPEFFNDDQLKTEFLSYRTAKRQALSGQIAVVAGEGRRIEYVPAQIGSIDAELRAIDAEARMRGLAWAGDASAITVEIG
ncbi:MAG: hypothetical protein K2X76_05145 [Sphingomonas sp.]|nr:hypothetical protein [Sphingomonas sp.]